MHQDDRHEKEKENKKEAARLLLQVLNLVFTVLRWYDEWFRDK